MLRNGQCGQCGCHATHTPPNRGLAEGRLSVATKSAAQLAHYPLICDSSHLGSAMMFGYGSEGDLVPRFALQRRREHVGGPVTRRLARCRLSDLLLVRFICGASDIHSQRCGNTSGFTDHFHGATTRPGCTTSRSMRKMRGRVHTKTRVAANIAPCVLSC